MKTLVSKRLVQSIMTKEAFAEASNDDIIKLSGWMVKVFKNNGKLFIFGNGGSAADSQHMAAEFVNRYLINRPPLPAIALTCDTSILTSIANDFSYNQVFSRQLQALGRAEDLALGISTSAASENVIKGLRVAKEIGMKTAALTGGISTEGREIYSVADLVLNVPSDFTPHIQETHLWVEHLLCEMVEKEMFGEGGSH